MIIRKWILVCIFICIPFILAKNSYASAPQILSYPQTTLTLDTPFIISATMSSLSKASVYRLRIVLAQSGTSNYFGSTYNGASWYNGTPSPINYSNFFTITTDGNGSWSGDVQGKIDSDDPNFTTGNGTYDLKIGRYTQTGSTATWSDPVSINVIIPPTPTSTPSPTPIPTNTPIPLAPTLTKIPTQVKIPTVIASLSTTNTVDISPTDEIPSDTAVLGEATEVVSPTASLIESAHTQRDYFPVIIFIFSGIILAICGILFAFPDVREKIYAKFTHNS